MSGELTQYHLTRHEITKLAEVERLSELERKKEESIKKLLKFLPQEAIDLLVEIAVCESEIRGSYTYKSSGKG